jgi:hypothetical protein
MPTYPAPERQANVPAPSPTPVSPLKSDSSAPSILPNLVDDKAWKSSL